MGDLALCWLMLFGVWPLADPGHTNLWDPLVWLDWSLHLWAAWMIGRRLGLRVLHATTDREAGDG